MHYEDTIKQRVELKRIVPHVSQDMRARPMAIFGVRPIAIWGSEAVPRNRSNFEGWSPECARSALRKRASFPARFGAIRRCVPWEEVERALWP